MYLKSITINNFRGISTLTLEFRRGLNILIGENNAGKTAIIDALRICMNYGNIQRDKYFNKDFDFHIHNSNSTALTFETQFDLYFAIETPVDISVFRELLKVNEDGSHDLQMHFKYYMDKEKLRYKVWGGAFEGQQINSDVLQLINHIHVDALRDADQHLKPFRDSKISNLFDGMIDYDTEQKRNLAKKVSDAMQEPEWKAFIEKGKDKINAHLKETTFDGGDKKQSIEITPTGFGIRDILNNLRIQIPFLHASALNGGEQKYLHLSQNGLGYNNLIYISTILGDIVQQKENEKEAYYSLLIEEPEAHLHPQLQSIFFEYLNTLSKKNSFQIFVTSHSPTITAKADLNSIIVLQSRSGKIDALPIWKSSLTKENKLFLHKFLDVTKSQLFFSNGVILLEGAEAFLLPIFAKKMGERFNLRRNGIEPVITGTSFEPFANLYKGANRLQNRCSILTDDDRDLIKANDFRQLFIDSSLATRKERNENQSKAVKLANGLFKILGDKKYVDKFNRISNKFQPNREGFSMKLGAKFSSLEPKIIKRITELQKKSDRTLKTLMFQNDRLKVFDASITFEYAFLVASETNFNLSLKIWKQLHPTVAKEIWTFRRSGVTLEEAAYHFLEKISSMKGGKSDFSYFLAEHLEENSIDFSSFTVPDYIQNAIKWVITGEYNVP